MVCGSHIQLGEVGNSRALSQTLGPKQCPGVGAGVWRGLGLGGVAETVGWEGEADSPLTNAMLEAVELTGRHGHS